MAGDLLAGRFGLRFGNRQFAQVHLRRVRLDHALLALLSEELALEPLELMLGGRMRLRQFDDLPGCPGGRLGGCRNARQMRCAHARHSTANPCIHAA